MYKIAVHEQNIPNVTKFSYLKGSIRNIAATAIYGISVTNDNYPVAIKILQDKFGKKEHYRSPVLSATASSNGN